MIEEFQRILGLKSKIGSDDYTALLEAFIHKHISKDKTTENTGKDTDSYRNLFYLAPVGYLVWDFNQKIHSTNVKASEVFLLSGEELRNISLRELVHQEYIDVFYFHIEQLRGGRPVVSCDLKVKSGSGKARFMRLISNLSNEIEPKIQSILLDVEAQKEFETRLVNEASKARESDLLKSTFLANMSYEIRTPMNSIIGFSNLIVDRTMSEEQKKVYLKTINESGNQLLNIINDILDISKLDSGQMKIDKSECNMIEICSYCYNVLSHEDKLLKNKNLDLRLQFSEMSRGINVYSDSERIKQVLLKLLDNALKFTDKGYVEFGFNIKQYNNKPFVEFFVKDTGCGIPIDKISKIFDRFYQIDKTDVNQGVGLGLSIGKGIIELLGGEIHVSSKQNQGTIFSFTIPYHSLPSKKEDVKSKVAKTPEIVGNLVVIAEDNDASYMYLRELLSGLNVTVKRAKNGRELLSIVDKQEPLLVLLDINMPAMNGYEALLELKKRQVESKIIIQTAYALSEEKQKFLNAGVDAYLTKPLNRKHVMEIIIKVLNG